MRRLIKSRDYLKRCLGFLLIFGFISLGAIGGCNNNGGDPDIIAEDPDIPAVPVVDPDIPVVPVVDPDSLVGIAVDGENLVVVDSGLNAVVQVNNPAGERAGERTIISTLISVPADDMDMGMGKGVGFLDPRGIAVYGDYFWVVDSGLNAVIRVVKDGGKRTELVEPEPEDDMDMVAFVDPRGIAVYGDGLNLVVVDSGAVVQVKTAGERPGERTIISGRDSRPDGFKDPRGIAVDETDVDDVIFWVVDSGQVIEVNEKTGTRTELMEPESDMMVYLVDPRGIAVDGENLVVVDSDAVVQVNKDTGVRTIISMIISKPEDDMDVGVGKGVAFVDPRGIAVYGDGDGEMGEMDLVVVDSGLNAVVQVIRKSGKRTIISDDG